MGTLAGALMAQPAAQALGPEPLRFRLPAEALRELPAGVNPYAPEQFRVDLLISGPASAPTAEATGDDAAGDPPPKPAVTTVTLPAFWYEPQRRLAEPAPVTGEEFAAASPGEWQARWLPGVPGEYRLRWRVWRRGHIREWPAEPVTVSAAQAAGAGALVQVSDGAFATRGGAPFIPVGFNLGWPDASGLAGYLTWLDRLAAAGGNATRLWLVPYFLGTALEGPAGQVAYAGAGQYNQAAAARVDAILAHAASRGVRVMLTLHTFGPFAGDWPKHPWHQANGGWLQHPGEIFLDARALAAARAQLRYAVARWGAAPALWAWELWNEVDGVRGYQPEAALAWHQDLARDLRRLDLHQHPVSTSYQQGPPMEPAAAFGLRELDFAQLHLYRSELLAATPRRLADLADFGKPVLMSEFSLLPWGEGLEHDPAGLHLHDGLWAGIMAGGVGGGFGWWWDTWVMPRQLEWQLTGLARFTAGEDARGSRPLPASLAEAPAGCLALARRHGADRFLAWVAAPRVTRLRDLDQRVVLAGYAPVAAAGTEYQGTLVLTGDFTGTWELQTYDPYDGLPLSRTRVTGTAEGLRWPLPAWRLDLAIKGLRLADDAAPDHAPVPVSDLPLRARVHALLEAAAQPEAD